MNSNNIFQSLTLLKGWLEREDFEGYDTFDGLSSPLAGIFTLKVPFLRQVWQQGVRRFPINLRPLLGIRPAKSSKGMGFIAQGYLRLFRATGDEEYLRRMNGCLSWLEEQRATGFKGYCWGNHFDYQARGGRIPKGTPTIVWTSLIGQSFLDAFEETQEERYFDISRGIARFILEELGWTETPSGICLSYIPRPGGKVERVDGIFRNSVHNSNMLGAAFLARLSKTAGNRDWAEFSKRAVEFTIHDQLENGGWNYGLHPMFHWIDSFHTGYVLESLDTFIRSTGDSDFQENLKIGYQYFLETFFESDGFPRYYDHKRRPIDIQCASQGIQTLVNLSHLDSRSLDLAGKVAAWTIANMQDKSGYFYYRKYPLITNKTPTLHWGQGTMFAALAVLYENEK